MKKIVVFILIVLCSVNAFAFFSTGFSVGILNSVNIGYKFDFCEVNAKIYSSAITGTALANSLLDEEYKIDNKALHGLSIDAFFDLFERGFFLFELGPDVDCIYVNLERQKLKATLIQFNVCAKFDFAINRNNSISLYAGYPLLAYINYEGNPENLNYAGFDFWAFIPKAIRELEKGKYLGEGKASMIEAGLCALNLRIGYTYRFN